MVVMVAGQEAEPTSSASADRTGESRSAFSSDTEVAVTRHRRYSSENSVCYMAQTKLRRPFRIKAQHPPNACIMIRKKSTIPGV